MWVVRELLRLLVRIAVAVAIAVVIAGVKVAVAGGDLTHTFKVTLFLLAAFMLLLATAGAKGTAGNRRLNQRVDHASNFVLRIPGVPAGTEGPTLTASAVFVGSALALVALAIFV
jgi:predicted membrane channel-forming protein YqfA (hemolysin III family)